MPIITTSEVKTLLQINNTSKDTLIDLQIPIVTEFVHAYTHNHFVNNYVRVFSSHISFSSSTKTITYSDATFLINGFQVGQDIYVSGSKNNDGVYQISAVTSNVITLSAKDAISDELTGNLIAITKVEYPKGLKLSIAKLIGFDINNLSKAGMKSESISRYSVSYSPEKGGYPTEITSGLDKYRKLKW